MRTAAALVLMTTLLVGCGGEDGHDAPAADESTAHESTAHEWTYEDVDAWGETCATGTEQSPVDLADAEPEALADPELAYAPSAATVVDNGHTVQTDLDDAGTMTLDGESYRLLQFHFHAPSEHHVDGVPYAAEMHLVHQAEDGSLAVLGVLVEEGAAHPVVADVLDHAPEAGVDAVATSSPVDPEALLPDDRRTFRYPGSLTTPPCTEGVAWSVLEEPVTWSAEQVAHFTDLHPGSHRPPQPLGERVLLHDTD